MTTNPTGYMRRWRQTERGQQSVRARVIAQTRAVKWVIANEPEIWSTMLKDARVEVGLPAEAVVGRPRREAARVSQG